MDNRPQQRQQFAELASSTRVDAVIAGLIARGFGVEVVRDAAAAKQRVLEMIPIGSAVFTGTSLTLEQSGIADELDHSGRFDAIRPKALKLDRATQRGEIKKLMSGPGFVVGSCHAITEDGAVMTASATGSQISHYAFDADRVILVCGTQKLVRDEREGMRRIEDYCLPLESERTKKAYGVPATLATILTARIDYPAKRTSIILVTQELGF